ncbi:uncharacterized protein LOC133914001 [Phragmites australis]|uniref:uncharacterized protein LOC133914001 n=1 Tax=Phragmites australis TaxID=29695 RepID=UPI002D77278F|nr:uncharacterized protein LOC133914001 [Phragmites australis]
MNVVGHQAHEEKYPNSEEAGSGPDKSGTAHNTEQEQSTDDGDFVNPLPRKRRAISKAPLSRKRHAEDAEASPVIPPKKRLASATRHSSRSPRPETQTIRGKDGKKGKLMSRCNPKDVLEAIRSLSDDQVAEIRRLGWGKFLEIKIDAVESRELYCFLMDHIDIVHMNLILSHDKILPISAQSIHIVLGLPIGGGELTFTKTKEITNAKKDLFDMLGEKLSIERLKLEVSKGLADELSLRCFFMIVFNRLLFPTSSYDVSNNDVRLTMDMSKIGEVDWCKLVVEDIRAAASQWQRRDCKIYYLDNLNHELNKGDRISIPRAALFDKHKVEHLTMHDRFTDRHGKLVYGGTQRKTRLQY